MKLTEVKEYMQTSFFLFTDIGTVKASYPTTLSKDIEELRHGSRRYPQAFNQGLNETSSCKCLILCYKLRRYCSLIAEKTSIGEFYSVGQSKTIVIFLYL